MQPASLVKIKPHEHDYVLSTGDNNTDDDKLAGFEGLPRGEDLPVGHPCYDDFVNSTQTTEPYDQYDTPSDFDKRGLTATTPARKSVYQVDAFSDFKSIGRINTSADSMAIDGIDNPADFMPFDDPFDLVPFDGIEDSSDSMAVDGVEDASDSLPVDAISTSSSVELHKQTSTPSNAELHDQTNNSSSSELHDQLSTPSSYSVYNMLSDSPSYYSGGAESTLLSSPPSANSTYRPSPQKVTGEPMGMKEEAQAHRLPTWLKQQVALRADQDIDQDMAEDAWSDLVDLET